MRCNNCGREIIIENGIVLEGVASLEIGWGYFSKKDGQRHKLRLCEKCYDQLIKQFAMPVEITQDTELV